MSYVSLCQGWRRPVVNMVGHGCLLWHVGIPAALESPEASSQTTHKFGADFGSCLETPFNNISAWKPQGKDEKLGGPVCVFQLLAKILL